MGLLLRSLTEDIRKVVLANRDSDLYPHHLEAADNISAWWIRRKRSTLIDFDNDAFGDFGWRVGHFDPSLEEKFSAGSGDRYQSPRWYVTDQKSGAGNEVSWATGFTNSLQVGTEQS